MILWPQRCGSPGAGVYTKLAINQGSPRILKLSKRRDPCDQVQPPCYVLLRPFLKPFTNPPTKLPTVNPNVA
jgi:hypothetical protein